VCLLENIFFTFHVLKKYFLNNNLLLLFTHRRESGAAEGVGQPVALGRLAGGARVAGQNKAMSSFFNL
jgi:hypothetical protein